VCRPTQVKLIARYAHDRRTLFTLPTQHYLYFPEELSESPIVEPESCQNTFYPPFARFWVWVFTYLAVLVDYRNPLVFFA